MNIEQYTFIGFLITCVFGLSLYAKYLVSKIIKITETNTSAFQELKHAVVNNTDAVKDLRQTLTLINK